MRKPREITRYRGLTSLLDERVKLDRRIKRYVREDDFLDHESALHGYVDAIRQYAIHVIAYGSRDELRDVSRILHDIDPVYDTGRPATQRERARLATLYFKPDELYAMLTGSERAVTGPVSKPSASRRSLRTRATSAPAQPSDSPLIPSEPPVAPPSPPRRVIQRSDQSPEYHDDLPPSVYQSATDFTGLLRAAIHYRMAQYPDDKARVLTPDQLRTLEGRKFTREFVAELATSLRGNGDRFLESFDEWYRTHHAKPDHHPKRRKSHVLVNDDVERMGDVNDEPDEEGAIHDTLRRRLD